MKKTLQYFKDEDLELGKSLTPTQIANWLEEQRLMHQEIEDEMISISLRMPKSLLESFKDTCKEEQVKHYQKQIRYLMNQWIHHKAK